MPKRLAQGYVPILHLKVGGTKRIAQNSSAYRAKGGNLACSLDGTMPPV